MITFRHTYSLALTDTFNLFRLVRPPSFPSGLEQNAGRPDDEVFQEITAKLCHLQVCWILSYVCRVATGCTSVDIVVYICILILHSHGIAVCKRRLQHGR